MNKLFRRNTCWLAAILCTMLLCTGCSSAAKTDKRIPELESSQTVESTMERESVSESETEPIIESLSESEAELISKTESETERVTETEATTDSVKSEEIGETVAVETVKPTEPPVVVQVPETQPVLELVPEHPAEEVPDRIIEVPVETAPPAPTTTAAPEPTTKAAPPLPPTTAAPTVAPTEPQVAPQPPAPPAGGEVRYILNTNTKKFHYLSCSSVKQIKPEHYLEFSGSRDEAMAQGYVPCKRCNP